MVTKEKIMGLIVVNQQSDLKGLRKFKMLKKLKEKLKMLLRAFKMKIRKMNLKRKSTKPLMH